MGRVVSAYPWEGLEALHRAAVRAAMATRAELADALAPGRLEAGLGELLTSDVSLVVQRIGLGKPSAEAIHLEVDGVHVSVEVEPPLATAMLARVLGRPAAVGSGRLDATLRGSLAALLVEALRRVATAPPRLAAPTQGQERVELEVTALLDGRPYAARAWADVPLATRVRPRPLARLGSVPIALPLVVAVATMAPDDLAGLEAGDAWLPGAGWWIDPELTGSGALCAPASEAGIGVDLAPGQKIVVRGDRVTVPADTEETSMNREETADVVLDAPLVVRVELGAVSMTARDWATLGPGDVIEVGRRVAEPVVLRVAGREVARGELVNVEGELGVRIRELVEDCAS